MCVMRVMWVWVRIFIWCVCIENFVCVCFRVVCERVFVCIGCLCVHGDVVWGVRVVYCVFRKCVCLCVYAYATVRCPGSNYTAVEVDSQKNSVTEWL